MFIGSKFCPHCGAAAMTATAADLSVLKCPRCTIDMKSVMLGQAAVRECERCEGLWLDAPVFKLICDDREHQSIFLGEALGNEHKPQIAPAEQVRYVPCPHCRQLMNRVNFARCSDVIVDVCKGHGTWFDRDELRRIVEFLRGGGMSLAREKERHELEFQQEKLHGELIRGASGNATFQFASYSVGFPSDDDERLVGLSATRDLLKFLVD